MFDEIFKSYNSTKVYKIQGLNDNEGYPTTTWNFLVISLKGYMDI
jgi:hypothetical protein